MVRGGSWKRYIHIKDIRWFKVIKEPDQFIIDQIIEAQVQDPKQNFNHPSTNFLSDFHLPKGVVFDVYMWVNA